MLVEKDFWVCWTLRRVFSLPDPPARLLFKGGTSLSKVFNAIQRFSEDIDLSLDREALGCPAWNELRRLSGKKQQETVDKLRAQCRAVVRDDLLRMLQLAISDSLGSSGGWSLRPDPSDKDGLSLTFEYPRAVDDQTGSGYVAPSVKLEFGARSDHEPAVDRPLTPIAARARPGALSDAIVMVRVLAPERTFWEKATILHMWFHADPSRMSGGGSSDQFRRQSRHYYDLALLADHDIGGRALADLSMLQTVANHKAVFFRSARANYDSARPGTLRLVPREDQMDSLRRDYTIMREMFATEPPSFDQVIETLRRLESRINARV